MRVIVINSARFSNLNIFSNFVIFVNPALKQNQIGVWQGRWLAVKTQLWGESRADTQRLKRSCITGGHNSGAGGNKN